MILIAYDGSDDAKAAIEQAGKLFPGETATVLTVWERFIDTMARAAPAPAWSSTTTRSTRDAEQVAPSRSQEGAKLAKEAGSTARREPPSSIRRSPTRSSPSGHRRRDARSSPAAAANGRQVADARQRLPPLVQHADLPVVVVPSPAVQRRGRSIARACSSGSATCQGRFARTPAG